MKKLLSAFLAFAFVVISAQAIAGISMPTGLMGNAVLSPIIFDAGDGSLQDINSSAVADIDATFYDGSSQNMLSKVTVPADGSLQEDYAFYLGLDGTVEANNPTFNVDKFDLDGGDWFRTQKAAATIGVTLRNAHKTTAGIKWTIFVAGETGSSISAKSFWGNSAQNSAHGVGILSTSGGDLDIKQTTGIFNTFTTLDTSVFSTNTKYLLAISFDGDTDTLRTWIASETSNDFTSAWQTETSDPTKPWDIMASEGFQQQTAGAEFYHFSVFNTFFTNADYIAIKDELATRSWGTFITW